MTDKAFRRAFEEWAGVWLFNKTLKRTNYVSGRYVNETVEDCWNAWRTASEHQQTPPKDDEHHCRYREALNTAHKLFAHECDQMKQNTQDLCRKAFFNGMGAITSRSTPLEAWDQWRSDHLAARSPLDQGAHSGIIEFKSSWQPTRPVVASEVTPIRFGRQNEVGALSEYYSPTPVKIGEAIDMGRQASLTKLGVERKVIDLPKALFNEAAKPPYSHLFAMTDLGNLLFAALDKAGCKPLFRSDNPNDFDGIEINVVVEKESE